MRTWPLSRSDVARSVESGTEDMVRNMAWGVDPGGGGADRKQRLSGQCKTRS